MLTKNLTFSPRASAATNHFQLLRALFCGTVLALLGAGCATTETGRWQLKAFSDDQEMQLGLSAFEQMKKEVPISKDPAANALVKRVGERIAAQAKSRLPKAQWEFVVFESKEANAFCLPGGKVGIYTGILPITANEAGLATVIGHEVAHASQHHGNERMSIASVVQKGTQYAGDWMGTKISPQNAQYATIVLGGLGKYGVELPYGRRQESEADQVGQLYMARAGYDPEETVKFWERFKASHSGQQKTSSLLSTHPLDDERIANLKKWMPEAKKAAAEAKVGR